MDLSRYCAIYIFFFSLAKTNPPYLCNETKTYRRPYGEVNRRVRCEMMRNNLIAIIEYKGNIQHGFQVDYDTLWRKKDSSFFINGKKQGLSLSWDTLGHEVGREMFRSGHPVGKSESYFSPGRPAVIKHFDARGDEDGAWEEWWPNGNKRAEYVASHGHLISGKEFYSTGKPSRVFSRKPNPKKSALNDWIYIEGEAWAPNGKSTGRIVNGNGAWIIFSDEPNRKTGKYEVSAETYKDSSWAGGHTLDSTEVASWLK
jgi:antitoxin component YwqK of YwqJK toxin-antitoxin module